MISENSIRLKLIEKMIEKWPRNQYSYYLREVRDSYRYPCFFVLVDLESEKPGSPFTVFKQYTVSIRFYEEGHKETSTIALIDGMREIFLSSGFRRYFNLRIDDRYLEIIDLEYHYVGEYMNIPEISFRLEFFDTYATKDDREIMRKLALRLKTYVEEV